MREEVLTQVKERIVVGDQLLCLWVLLLPLVLILSLRKLWGFSFMVSPRINICVYFLLYGFCEEKYLCLLSLVIIDVHVILLDKILDHID